MNKHFPAIAGLVSMALWGPLAFSGRAAAYYLLGEIPIGGAGSGTCMAIDAGAHRLYIAETSKIVIVDLEKEEVAGSLADTSGVRGLAIASELGRGFSSNARESKAGVIDLKSLKTVARVPTGRGPEAILFEPGRQEVYVFCGGAKSATVFDAATAKVVATIPLLAKAQSAIADPHAQRVYCDLPARNEVAALDTQQHLIVHTWPIGPGKEPVGMAIDTAHQRIFIGCRNKRLVMMDAADGRIAGTAPIGEGVVDEVFDPATQLIFSCSSDGTAAIAHEDSPERLTVLQTLPTRKGAHTVALDTATHKIYLAAADYEAQPDPEPDEPRKRARMIPGTLKILIYGMAQTAGQQ